jgi:AbrB family looped-hinge helix DNA binding protein
MASLSVVSAHQLKPGTIAAVIPKAIREKIGIDRGTELVVYESDGEVIMVPLSKLKASRRARTQRSGTVRLSASSD